MKKLSMRGTHGAIEIRVIRYENSNATCSSDANWLACEIDIAISPFRATYTASLSTSDFLCFRDELILILEQKAVCASLVSEEEWLRINLEMNSRGICAISGDAIVMEGADTKLSFAFELDNTSILDIKSDLESITSHFPIRQSQP